MNKLKTVINGITLNIYYQHNPVSIGDHSTPTYGAHNELIAVSVENSTVDIQYLLSEDIISQIEKEIEI